MLAERRPSSCRVRLPLEERRVETTRPCASSRPSASGWTNAHRRTPAASAAERLAGRCSCISTLTVSFTFATKPKRARMRSRLRSAVHEFLLDRLRCDSGSRPSTVKRPTQSPTFALLLRDLVERLVRHFLLLLLLRFELGDLLLQGFELRLQRLQIRALRLDCRNAGNTHEGRRYGSRYQPVFHCCTLFCA